MSTYFPVEPHHVEPFDRRRGDAYHLHDNVGAAPVGELLHAGDPSLGRRVLVHVDDVGGAALPRQGQPRGLTVHRDHARGALLRGHRRRVDPQAARALDHYHVAELHLRRLQPVEHLAQRAVHGGNGVVGQLDGHLEDVVAGGQVVVLRVPAVAVRVLVQGELVALALPVRAGVMLAADAPVAAVARVEEGEGDAVALLERVPEGVELDALAQDRYHAGELVAGDAPDIRPRVVAVVAPVVEVGAADGGGGVLDEEAARLDFRRG
jgi:hypothetical protein